MTRFTIIDELNAIKDIDANDGNPFARKLIVRKIIERVWAVDGVDNAIEVFDLKISEAVLLRSICS